MTRLRTYKTILSPIVFTCKVHTLLLNYFSNQKIKVKRVFQVHWEAQLGKNVKDENKKQSPTSTAPLREGSPVFRTSSTVHQRPSRWRATAVKGSEGENNARIFCLLLAPYSGAKPTLEMSIGVLDRRERQMLSLIILCFSQIYFLNIKITHSYI